MMLLGPLNVHSILHSSSCRSTVSIISKSACVPVRQACFKAFRLGAVFGSREVKARSVLDADFESGEDKASGLNVPNDLELGLPLPEKYYHKVGFTHFGWICTDYGK